MKNNTNILIGIFAGLIVLALVFARFGFHVKGPANQTNFEKEFGTVLQDYDGHDIHLYDYRRKVLVAYTWASWCTYCGKELENLGTLKQKYGENIQIIAVNRAEPRVTAKSFTDGLQNVANIVFLLDPSDRFFKSIDGYAMPETVFINGKGEIIFHQRGPLQLEEVSKKMEELLK